MNQHFLAARPRPWRWLAGLALALLCGCDHGPDHSEEAGHDHHHADDEPKTAQITVWGERHEIFAEHRLAVVDKPTTFITHVTDLQTFRPRRRGPVTFILTRSDGFSIELEEEAPSRAGIYEAMLTFSKKGEWNVSVRIPGGTNDVPDVVVLPAVQVFGSDHDVAHAEVDEEVEGISFLKEQQWKISFRTERLATRRLVERLGVPATVTARPGGWAEVSTPLSGRLLPPRGGRLPAMGDRVDEGQILALVQPTFSEIGARLVEAESAVGRTRLALAQAERDYQRTRQLAQAEAKSERELQEAEYAFKSARADYEAAVAMQASYRQISELSAQELSEERKALPAIELRSPIAGVIDAQLGIPPAGQVTAETTLFTVLDNSMVYIEGAVPEADLGRLSAAKGASYELPSRRGQFTRVIDAGGRLVYTGRQVDSATRTVRVIYEVNNTGPGLRIGQMLNLHIETRRAEQALALPESAIVEEGATPVAFVHVSGETFQKRELTLGLRDGAWVQVLSGLEEGERVVTRGAMAIRLASVSSVIPDHGHVH